ncbi:MAG: IPT/TIG domain-containing protein, partial [Candidatus Sulfotelmatobacter sp.]
MTAPLVSITVSPSNPTLSAISPQTLQLTATGTYADGSTGDLTLSVNWTSSNSSVATLVAVPGSPAFVLPVSNGSTNITATFGGISGSTTLTVNTPLAPAPPIVIGVSPTSGAAGTPVTITGSGFGTTQGSGAVWLGTNLGSVVSWSDGQVVATVTTGSTSGAAQIQQNGAASNSVPFTINTAAIISVSPNNGLAGTQVTISGSGFGAMQGSGNVWLGTVPAIMNSWSDGQVIATVAAGAATGNAMILQNGVMSNAVPFTINLPQITGITPNTGSAGTVVTITGVSFGATQGNGNVWIGSTYGSVIGWSNTQVTASVSASAVSGIVKIEQNGVWSNATTFTVPTSLGGGGGSSSVTLVPNVISLAVGGTQSIQALNSSGQSVTGLTWTSSNAAVATLSTDDPPIITAVAAGNTTITAGSASADVTVIAASTLPTGTVLWSNPGDGSGVSSIVPAVPSSTGVADVFAFQGDGSVQAITSTGTTAWTAPNVFGSGIPDFQGGLVVNNSQSVYKLDGITGQAYPAYASVSAASGGPGLSTLAVHTDGTIFTVDGSNLVGINPLT